MNLFKLLFYYFNEYSLDGAISKANRDLLKLKSRVMNGDKGAEKLAWVALEQYDKLIIEFQNKHFNY